MERSKGVSQRELAKLLEVSRWTIQQVEQVASITAPQWSIISAPLTLKFYYFNCRR